MVVWTQCCCIRFHNSNYCLIYYFLPKESGQNVYSYKLSILAFWGLLFFILGWWTPLIYSTVPDWMQTMGSVMSVVLILPSWGSAINMLLTMKGEWQSITNKYTN